jgi:hypothetical protein
MQNGRPEIATLFDECGTTIRIKRKDWESTEEPG